MQLFCYNSFYKRQHESLFVHFLIVDFPHVFIPGLFNFCCYYYIFYVIVFLFQRVQLIKVLRHRV